MIGRKPKATITIEIYINGHPMRMHPREFTVQDGDVLAIDGTYDLPIVQRPDSVAGVRIQRVVEIIEPKVE